MKIVKIFAALAACWLLPIAPASAGPYGDKLGSCLSDSTTGKDRKDLARGLIVVMALHPEVASVATVTQANRDAVVKTNALLYKRLLTQDCKSELKAAVEHEGSDSVRVGFEILGRLAMQELMSNPEVVKGFSAFAQYIDKNSLK